MRNLMDQETQHFENMIQSIKNEIHDSKQEVIKLKDICLEHHKKSEALELKLKNQAKKKIM
jgi:uncharacterized surface protein with fasciclin (FAS1) repeats